MKESYRLHVYPETSLPFGLGVAYIALVGAVQCWNDTTQVKVRDGFGFIDSSRLQETFGNDYLTDIDVIHYTGSSKPWTANSTIGEPSLRPWLEAMEREQLPIPQQLSSQPAKELFMILGSSNTDSERIMNVLDHHPAICASGESYMPEIGYPSGLLNPDGISWYPNCSVKKGCTYGFVRDSIWELTRDTLTNATTTTTLDHNTSTLPTRCMGIVGTDNPVAMSADDPLGRHLPQICNFITELNGEYTASAIAKVYIDAYQNDDKRLLRCACKRGAVIKGVHIQPDWLVYEGYPNEYNGPPRLEINTTQLAKHSKVIRIQRSRTIWAQVKARLFDEATQIWNPQTIEERNVQLSKLGTQLLMVDIGDLQRRIQHIRTIDEAGDSWIRDHIVGDENVLWIQYEDCRNDATHCLHRIGTFLGMDDVMSPLLQEYSNNLEESMFTPMDLDNTLDYIQNKDDVYQTLLAMDVVMDGTTTTTSTTAAAASE